MKNLSDFTYADIKAMYDFLELRKEIVSLNSGQFEKEQLHTIIAKQKYVWQELHTRLNAIQELKSFENE